MFFALNYSIQNIIYRLTIAHYLLRLRFNSPRNHQKATDVILKFVLVLLDFDAFKIFAKQLILKTLVLLAIFQVKTTSLL